MLEIDKITPQQLLKASEELSLTKLAKQFGCSRDTVKRRLRAQKPQVKAQPKSAPKPDRTRPQVKLAMTKVMGKRTMNSDDVIRALTAKNWLPNAKAGNHRQYIGYLLSTTKKLFERDHDQGRGFYRVRQDASALITELEKHPLKKAHSGMATLQVVCKGERWRAMKSVWEACERAGLEVPREVRQYFMGAAPTPEGIVLLVPVAPTNPVSFNRRDLPEDATSLLLTVPLAGLGAETEFTLSWN